MIMEIKICNVIWQGRDQGELMVQFQSEAQQPDVGEQMVQMKSRDSVLENSLLLGDAVLFVLIKPSVDWMKPTYFMEDSLLTQSQ